MEKTVVPTGNENVKNAIKAIGKSLIERADDISNDIKFVRTICISATLTPEEVVNFDITKNYLATFSEN